MRMNNGFERDKALWRGMGAALLLSILGAMVFSFGGSLLGSAAAARLGLTILSLLYLLYILQTSPAAQKEMFRHSQSAKRGVLVSLALWLVLTLLLYAFNPSIWIWLVVLTGFSWLVRCFRSYRSLWLAAGDALVNGVALILSLLTALHTHSVFLSLWCFFLIQAALVFLPGVRRSRQPSTDEFMVQQFDDAYRSAEAALSRIVARKITEGEQ